MERMHFADSEKYSALEAAIHLLRYSVVKKFCPGKRVLDIACGEGYGSALMADWGAAHVDGVDIDESAVLAARRLFSRDNVFFRTASGEDAFSALEQNTYDLIVSLETLEHVTNVDAYLESLAKLRAEGGIVIISCPNDHWYYGDGPGNPYHRRRLTFDEFRILTERHLGEATQWRFGTLCVGFSIVDQESLDVRPESGSIGYATAPLAHILPSGAEAAADAASVGFYLGMWGGHGQDLDLCFAGYPASMDLGRQVLFPPDRAWGVPNDYLDRLQSSLTSLRRELSVAKDRLRASASDARRWRSELHLMEMSIAERVRDVLTTAGESLEVESFSNDSAAVQALVNSLITKTRQFDEENQIIKAEGFESSRELPWRVIRLWKHLRRLIPRRLLNLTGRLLLSR